MMTVTLPYPPSLNRLWRTAGGRTYLSPQAKAFKGAAARVGPAVDGGALAVSVREG